jgi:ABC-2 type transporter.
MGAIIRRELNAYFFSPIGYVFLTVYLLITGIAFKDTIASLQTNLSQVFGAVQVVAFLVVPVLTMRLLSEERKSKSDQALMTAPVSLTSIVYGKFIAAILVYTLASLVFIIYGLVLSIFGPFIWSEFFTNFVGTLLMGYVLIAVGLFVSSLTENQVVAAILSFAVVFVMMFVHGMLANYVAGFGKTVVDIVDSFALPTRLQSFYSGTLVFSDVFYFISFIVILNFFTTRVLERRRYA